MDPAHAPRLPRAALLGAAVLVGATLLLAGAARLTGAGATPAPVSTPLERRDLRFEDRADGGVAVVAAPGDRVVQVLPPGEGGFVRGVLRGLARERRSRGVGPEAAFSLTRWADGRLSLADPETGRTIELSAFGPTNARAFAQLLETHRE